MVYTHEQNLRILYILKFSTASSTGDIFKQFQSNLIIMLPSSVPLAFLYNQTLRLNTCRMLYLNGTSIKVTLWSLISEGQIKHHSQVQFDQNQLL